MHEEGSNAYHFSANKIFIWLFILTALEVGWGVGMHGTSKLILWTGLIGCALVKGLLIAIYFMHLKFEGWIVKGLILPTPFLIIVILTAVSPDISRNHKLIHPIGSYVDTETGHVLEEIPNDAEPADH